MRSLLCADSVCDLLEDGLEEGGAMRACQEHAEKMPRKCREHAENMPRTCREHAENMIRPCRLPDSVSAPCKLHAQSVSFLQRVLGIKITGINI